MCVINMVHVMQFAQLVICTMNAEVWVIYYIITGGDDLFVIDNVDFYVGFGGMKSIRIMIVCCNLSTNVCDSILYSFSFCFLVYFVFLCCFYFYCYFPVVYLGYFYYLRSFYVGNASL
jgi:hypothetical protein